MPGQPITLSPNAATGPGQHTPTFRPASLDRIESLDAGPTIGLVEALSSVVESISHGYWIYDIDCHRLYLSKSARDVIGVSGSEFLSDDYLDHCHPADRALVEASIASLRMWESISPPLIHRVVFPDNTIRWVELSGAPLPSHPRFAAGYLSCSTQSGVSASLSTAFSVASDMMAICDKRSGRIIEVNKQFSETLGLHGREVVGRTFPEIGVWSDRDSISHALGLTCDDLEAVWISHNGERLTVRIHSSEVALGNWRCQIFSIRDITDERRKASLLKAAEIRYDGLFLVCPEPLAITTLPEGEILRVNTRFEEVLGYKAADVIGKTTEEVGIWPTKSQRQNILDKLIHLGKVDSTGNEQVETTVRHKSGSLLQCVISSRVVELDGKLCAVSSMKDMTSYRQAEAALRESELKFATAFHSSPDGLVILNVKSRRMIDVNQGFCTMTGYSSESLLNKKPSEADLWNSSAERQAVEDMFLSRGRMYNAEIHLKTRSGYCALKIKLVTKALCD